MKKYISEITMKKIVGVKRTLQFIECALERTKADFIFEAKDDKSFQ